MKTEDIVKYALIAVGAYLVWEYIISPMMAGTGTTPTPAPGTTTTANTTTAPPTSTGTPIAAVGNTTTPQPGTTNPPSNVSTQNQNSLNASPLAQLLIQQANSSAPLNPDQWSYYYAQLPGRTALTASQMDTLLANGNITDRTQNITAQSFAELIQGIGLNGLGAIIYTPNNMGMGTLRGGFSGKGRPNAFSGSGRKTSYVQ